MILVNKITNVKRLFIVDEYFIYLKKINEDLYKICSNSFQIDLSSWTDRIFKLDDTFVVILSNGKGVVLNKKTNTLEALPFENVSSIQGKRVIFYYGGTFDKTYGVYDLLRQKVNFETAKFIGNFYFNDFGVDESQRVLICRNLNNGNIRWEFSLKPYGSYLVNGQERKMNVEKFIGVYNGTLYIKAGTILILGVDIVNGNEVFKYKKDGKKHLFLGNLELDHERGVIFSVGPKHYFETNLHTNDVTLSDHSEDTIKHAVQSYKLGSWNDHLIYFWEGHTNNKFGVFDRRTKRIIFSGAIEEVAGKFSAIRDVKYNQHKLYVLDYYFTLHIFDIKDLIV